MSSAAMSPLSRQGLLTASSRANRIGARAGAVSTRALSSARHAAVATARGVISRPAKRELQLCQARLQAQEGAAPQASEEAACGAAPGPAAPLAAMVLPMMAAMPALAEEALADAEVSSDSNLAVTIIFTLAIIALSVLTLGVAYLSVMQYMDKQQEKKDKEEFELGGSKSVLGDKKAKKAESSKPKKDRKKAVARNGKGFGKSVDEE